MDKNRNLFILDFINRFFSSLVKTKSKGALAMLKLSLKVFKMKRIQSERKRLSFLAIFAILILLPFAVTYSAAREFKGGTKPHNVFRIIVHPLNHYLMYALDEFRGVFKSTDRGNSWTEKNAGLDQLPEILPPRVTHGYYCELAIDRISPNILYVVRDSAIFKSEDGGETWIFSGRGTESTDYATGQLLYCINEVVVHPKQSGTVFAGTMVGGATGGLFKSTDAGATWVEIAGNHSPGSGLGNDATPIVIDPDNPLLMYSGGVHSTFFRSSDGGYHWERREPPNNLDGCVMGSGLALNPMKPGELFMGASVMIPNLALKSYRSVDYGATWVDIPQIDGAFQSMEFFSGGPSRVFAVSTIATRYPANSSELFLYRSDDNGITWMNLGSYTSGLRCVTIDLDDPNHIYLGTFHNGVIESFDGGRTINKN